MENTQQQPKLVPTEVFSCAKCGALLFRKDQLLNHKPPTTKAVFENKHLDKHTAHSCMSYFIKSCPPWVKNQDQIECKIYCPNCYNRVGMLHWQGSQFEVHLIKRGAWINPAIQFPMSKVDLKVVRIPERKKQEETPETEKPEEEVAEEYDDEEEEYDDDEYYVCFN